MSNPYPNRTIGIPCRVRAGGKQQSHSEKMKMPRDGAKVRRCSKKASTKRSTIKCFEQPRRTRRAANQSHNSRARRSDQRGLAYSSAPSACPPQRANPFGGCASDEAAAR